MSDVVMPRLSDSMEEGTILKWLKSSGDSVARGEELVEIETDKANMTYESDQEGVLEIIASEGDTLPVGVPIARIGDGVSASGGGAAAKPAEAEKAAPPTATTQAEQAAAAPTAQAAPAAPTAGASTSAPAAQAAATPAPATSPEPTNGRIKASPLARRMAQERGLSLSDIEGSGPGGRIVKADIEALAGGTAAPQAPSPAAPAPAAPAAAAAAPTQAAAPPPPPPVAAPSEGATIKGDVTVQELTKLQQVVARRMAESKATAPEFVLNIEVDMHETVELRKRLKELGPDHPTPSFNDFIVKATALALREFPRANGAYRDGKFELYSRINIGIAVAGQDALVVPTIFDADRKSIAEISQDARALAQRVRAGVITPPELSGGTFTVSNLGMFGIKNFTAVINPPQAAILAVGAMTERAVVRDGEITTRHILDLTISCDHRILYGADAAQFLNRIRERLEEPLLLAL